MISGLRTPPRAPPPRPLLRRKPAGGAMENIHSGRVRRKMVQGHILAPGPGVVKTQVALAEGPAAGTLAAQPHGRTFKPQRAHCERFANRPVDRPALFNRLFA